MICKQRSNIADWIVDKLYIDIDLIIYIYMQTLIHVDTKLFPQFQYLYYLQ